MVHLILARQDQHPEECKAHGDEFLLLHSELEDVWDGHLGRIETVRHRIERTFNEISPVHRAVYCAGQSAIQFPAEKVQKMLQEEVLEPANTERTRHIVLAPEKDGSLKFCVD